MTDSNIDQLRKDILEQTTYELPSYQFMIDMDPVDNLLNDYYDIFYNTSFKVSSILTAHVYVFRYWWPSVLHMDFLYTRKTTKLSELFTKETPWTITHTSVDFKGNPYWKIRYNCCVLKELNLESINSIAKKPGFIQTIFDIKEGFDYINI